MRVLAVDPGKMSGWAFVNTADPSSFTADQAPMLEVLDLGWNVLSRGRVDVVVCEAYVITARSLKVSRGENWSLESNGVFRWMCHTHDVEYADEQTAADGKRFGTDAKLRRVGWYLSTKGGHRNDAARHLLKYVADHDQPAFMLLWQAGGS